MVWFELEGAEGGRCEVESGDGAVGFEYVVDGAIDDTKVGACEEAIEGG